MTQGETLKRYIDAGMAFTQMTRDRAEAVVRELVKAGEIQRENAQERVEELVERGRKGSDALIEMVRKEVARQLAGLGVATKQDLAELEERLATRPDPPVRPRPKAKTGQAASSRPAEAPARSAPAPARSADESSRSAPDNPVDEPGSG
ncbi:MAG TPA: hypothetical protein VMZ73_04105 [Acidimicrobiales bacterium]|nr:hypothetical protein [Acidimicrobiales bacterium]